MGFSLFGRSGAPEQVKASGTAPVMAFHGTGRAVWSPRDHTTLTRNGYEANAIGFRAVRMVAEASAAVPLTTTENGARMTTHPVVALLAQPSPTVDASSFLETVYGHLLLSGNAYVEGAVHDAAGLPRELHAIRPDRMRVVPGTDGWPMAYEYAVGQKKHRWSMAADVRPILHLKGFHPLNDHYGMSPLVD